MYKVEGVPKKNLEDPSPLFVVSWPLKKTLLGPLLIQERRNMSKQLWLLRNDAHDVRTIFGQLCIHGITARR